MVMFDLAWMMSKDLNDMLWYVVPSQVQYHTWLLCPSSSVLPQGGEGLKEDITMGAFFVPTGNIGCGLFLGMCMALVFFPNCEALGTAHKLPCVEGA